MAYNVPEVRFYYLLTPAVFGSFIYSSYSCFSNNMKLFLLFLVCFVCREPSYCSICASFLNEMLLANGSKAWEIWLLLNLPSSGFKACTEVRTQKFTIFWRWKYCQNKKEKKQIQVCVLYEMFYVTLRAQVAFIERFARSLEQDLARASTQSG